MQTVDGSRAAVLAAVLLTLLAGGVLLGPPAAAATAGPTAGIALSRDSGPPGTPVTVSLTCGTWDEGWDIALEGLGTKRNDVHIGSEVRFSTGLSVPSDAPGGPTTVDATCTPTAPVPDRDRTGPDPTLPKPITLTATFTVEKAVVVPPATIVPRPDHGTAGVAVSVTGDRLPACDPAGWTVVIGGSIQAPKVDVPVGAHAVFAVVVPGAAPVGRTEVALDCVGKPVATAAFRVDASPPSQAPTKPPVTQPPIQQPPTQQPPVIAVATVVVPDLTGLTLVQAASALSGRALALGPGGEPDRGVVTGQQPAAGTQVAPGTAVSVEQAAPTVAVSGSLALPGAGLGVLALAAAAAVLRAQRTKAGREWARRHVRVVVGGGGGRR
jgi:hypothetical protein